MFLTEKTIDFMRTHRQDFHQNPELGFQEIRTKQKIIKALTEMGIEVSEGIGVTGILSNGSGSGMIGLRADMDALPISETTSLPYASQKDGIMHACGHDGHMAMLLGAARHLASERNFDGTVVFIFQPNEENGLGSQAMLDEGFLSRFPLDEVYALHNLPGAPLGQLSTRVGEICASESLFELKITARGGHSAMPHKGVDAIIVGSELALSLQTIISRKLPPEAGAVLSITEFMTNGQRNILPGSGLLKGDTRAFSKADRKAIELYIRQIASGISQAHDVDIQVTFETEFIETINAPTPTEAACRAASKLGYDLIPDRQPMSFSEDFANFSKLVPGSFLLLGNGTVGAASKPLHSSEYDFNDDALPIGASFWVNLVSDRLPLKDCA